MRKRLLSLILISAPIACQAMSWQAVVQWFVNLNNENSAWSVVTKQTAIASNQIATNDVRSKQMLSIAIGSIAKTEKLKKNIINFSAAYGQPESNLCLAISQQNSFVKNMANHKLDLMGRMGNFINSSISSEVEQKNILQRVHSDFCSVNEAKQGLCKLKPNGMQAWDTDYSAFSSKNNLEGNAEVGAIAYVQKISVNPTLTANNCKSTSCAEARIQSITYAARSSMITNTFLSQISIRRNVSIE